MAYITPVYKGNGASAHKLESYRPISAASVVCRTIENVMNRAIHKHLDTHALLSPAHVTFVLVEAVRLPILAAVRKYTRSVTVSTMSYM